VEAVVFDSAGVLVSGSKDGSIRIWDTSSGSTLKVLTGHTMKVEDLAFNDKGVLASASQDTKVKLWV